MSTLHAHIAVRRFGLGPSPADLEAAGSDPQRWLRAQLGPWAQPPELAALPGSSHRIAEFVRSRGRDDKSRAAMRQAFQEEVEARETWALRTPAPFRERLVAHWSNHFTVSTTQRKVTGIVGAYEREAIRPRVCGRFADMLLATAQHPAMLVYLDNARSTGPDSRAGSRRDRGLNENLAREILELHTLGVDGGYDQGDVEALAALLTGWTVNTEARRASDPAFVFDERRHQPGAKTLLGRRYGEGLDEGERALRDLAEHPSTAQNVARRFARHFLSDEPPEHAVSALARAFESTGGDNRALADTLLGLDAAWDPSLRKLTTPREMVLSTVRALELEPEAKALVGSQRQLGQEPFRAPSPQGWSDRSADWAGSEAVMDRVAWAAAVAERVGEPARDAADRLAGPLLTDRTRRVLRRAEGPDALALLIASPELQRR